MPSVRYFLLLTAMTAVVFGTTCPGTNAQCGGSPLPRDVDWDWSNCYVSASVISGAGVRTLRVYSHRELFLVRSRAQVVLLPSETNALNIPSVGEAYTRDSAAVHTWGGAAFPPFGVRFGVPTPTVLLNSNVTSGPNRPAGTYLTVTGSNFDQFNIGTTAPVRSFGFEFRDEQSTASPCDSLFLIDLRDGVTAGPLATIALRTNYPAAPVSVVGQTVFFGVEADFSFNEIRVREIVGGSDDERFGPFYFGDGALPGEDVIALAACDGAGAATPISGGLNPTRSILMAQNLRANDPTDPFSFVTLFELGSNMTAGSLTANQALVGGMVIGLPDLLGTPITDPFGGLSYTTSWLAGLWPGVPPFAGPLPASTNPVAYRQVAFPGVPVSWDIFANVASYSDAIPFINRSSYPTRLNLSMVPAVQWK